MRLDPQTKQEMAWAMFGLAVIAAIMIVTQGCGGSGLRHHATAATIARLTVANAGQGIEQAALSALDACPHVTNRQCPSEGSEVREECLACVRDVEEKVMAASAARDALIAPVEAYRDAVLTAQGADETDAILRALFAAAMRIVEEWGGFALAMRALGVEVPMLPFGQGGQ